MEAHGTDKQFPNGEYSISDWEKRNDETYTFCECRKAYVPKTTGITLERFEEMLCQKNYSQD